MTPIQSLSISTAFSNKNFASDGFTPSGLINPKPNNENAKQNIFPGFNCSLSNDFSVSKAVDKNPCFHKHSLLKSVRSANFNKVTKSRIKQANSTFKFPISFAENELFGKYALPASGSSFSIAHQPLPPIAEEASKTTTIVATNSSNTLSQNKEKVRISSNSKAASTNQETAQNSSSDINTSNSVPIVESSSSEEKSVPTSCRLSSKLSDVMGQSSSSAKKKKGFFAQFLSTDFETLSSIEPLNEEIIASLIDNPTLDISVPDSVVSGDKKSPIDFFNSNFKTSNWVPGSYDSIDFLGIEKFLSNSQSKIASSLPLTDLISDISSNAASDEDSSIGFSEYVYSADPNNTSSLEDVFDSLCLSEAVEEFGETGSIDDLYSAGKNYDLFKTSLNSKLFTTGKADELNSLVASESANSAYMSDQTISTSFEKASLMNAFTNTTDFDSNALDSSDANIGLLSNHLESLGFYLPGTIDTTETFEPKDSVYTAGEAFANTSNPTSITEKGQLSTFHKNDVGFSSVAKNKQVSQKSNQIDDS